MNSAWLLYYGKLLNFERKELMATPCGELYDLMACHQISNGAKEKKKDESIFDLMSKAR